MHPSPLALSTASSLSSYLVMGMHHLTPDGRANIAALIDAELAPLRARLDTLETTTRNAVIMWNHGMTVEAHRLVEQTLADLD